MKKPYHLTKISGYTINNLDKTIIVSSGAENGYPKCFMISVIKNGKLVSQEVVLNNDNFLDKVKRTNEIYCDFHWISRLSVSRLNKTSKCPVFGRNTQKTLFPLV